MRERKHLIPLCGLVLLALSGHAVQAAEPGDDAGMCSGAYWEQVLHDESMPPAPLSPWVVSGHVVGDSAAHVMDVAGSPLYRVAAPAWWRLEDVIYRDTGPEVTVHMPAPEPEPTMRSPEPAVPEDAPVPEMDDDPSMPDRLEAPEPGPMDSTPPGDELP